MNNFHNVVRGPYFAEGYVLLGLCIGADHKFLPGRQIRPGEKAPDCLSRELLEELIVENVEVRRFIGAVETKWEEVGIQNNEINLISQARLSAIVPPTTPITPEKHLEILGVRSNELLKNNLKPSPIMDYIHNHMDDERAYWGYRL